MAKIYVGPGNVVAEGAPLVDFDRAPFDAAAASAQAGVTVAEHAYDRAQRLTAAGIVARKDIDQAAADLAQAQTALGSAQRAEEFATLRAPLAGSRDAQVGGPRRVGRCVGPGRRRGRPRGARHRPWRVASDAPLVRRGDSVEVAAGQADRPRATGARCSRRRRRGARHGHAHDPGASADRAPDARARDR